MCGGSFQEPVIGCGKPSCARLFRKCKVQRIERVESECRERASAFCCYSAGDNLKSRCLEPQSRGQAPVFARIPLVLEIVSR